MVLYDDIFMITKSFFCNIDCGNCNNYGDGEKIACSYCSNENNHNLLWNVNDNHAHLFTKEIIKLVKENENNI